MIKLDGILVPVDFSDNSQKAARYATEMARTLGGKVYVVHVIHQRIIDSTQELSVKGYKGEFVEVMRSMVQSRKNDLDQFIPEAWRADLDVEFEIRKGKPADEIIKFAKEKNVDLIIVGTVGRSALQAAFTGSVANNLVNHAPCPVMVVRPGEHDFV
jgi:nucleotide-binding universal stress UspA family protein